MKKAVATVIAALMIITVALPLTIDAGGTPNAIFDTPECNAWSHNIGSWGLAYECLYSIVFPEWW